MFKNHKCAYQNKDTLCTPEVRGRSKAKLRENIDSAAYSYRKGKSWNHCPQLCAQKIKLLAIAKLNILKKKCFHYL